MNHNDAIKHGDGERVIKLYKYFQMFFKISNCPKYSIAMLHLQAQVNCLLTPRLACSLTWNRFVNHQGKQNTNHPMDLEIEHENKTFKNDCHSFHGEITDKSIARVSRSTEVSEEIVHNYDRCTMVKKPSGKHTKLSTEGDVAMIVEHLKPSDVFQNIPGRCHSAFETIEHDLLQQLDVDRYKVWISKSIKKFKKKHFYGT